MIELEQSDSFDEYLEQHEKLRRAHPDWLEKLDVKAISDPSFYPVRALTDFKLAPAPSRQKAERFGEFLSRREPVGVKLYLFWVLGMNPAHARYPEQLDPDRAWSIVRSVSAGWVRFANKDSGKKGKEATPTENHQPGRVPLGTARVVADVLDIVKTPDYVPVNDGLILASEALKRENSIVRVMTNSSLLSDAIEIRYATPDLDIDILATQPLEPFGDLPPVDPNIKI